MQLVLIYNNTLYWPPSDLKGPPQREPPNPASPYVSQDWGVWEKLAEKARGMVG